MGWITITNARVAAGARATTSLFTALRDNVAALAAGDAGAPRVQKEALGGLVLGALSGNTHSITDLDAVEELTQFFNYAINTGTIATLAYRVAFSDNNGLTWGTEVSLRSFNTPGGGGTLSSQGAMTVNIVTGAVHYFDGAAILNSTLTVPANCNAVRFRTTIDAGPSGNLNALYQVTGGRA